MLRLWHNRAILIVQAIGLVSAIVMTTSARAENPDNTSLSSDIRAALELAYADNLDTAESKLTRLERIWPANYEVKFALTRVLAWQGKHDEVDQHLSVLRNDFPESNDVKLLAARIASYRGDRASAKKLYLEVIAEDQENAEAYLGLGDLYGSSQDKAAAKGYFRLASHYAPNSPATLERSQRNLSLDGQRPKWRSYFGYEYSQLSYDANNIWRNKVISLERAVSDNWSLGAKVEQRSRYGLNDTVTAIRVQKTSSSGIRYGFTAAFAEEASFSEELQFKGSIAIPVLERSSMQSTTHLEVGGRHSRYQFHNVEVFTLSILQTLGGGHTMIKPSWIVVHDPIFGTQHGGALRLDLPLSGRISGRIAVADYPETELGSTARTQTVDADLAVDVNDRLSIRLGYTYADRLGSYSRNGIGIVVGARF